jgi:hypothetical protein
MGDLMLWQELAVAVIVGLAVAWLVRHMRGILSVPQSSAGASCHGCDNCGEAEEVAPAPRPGSVARLGPGTIH